MAEELVNGVGDGNKLRIDSNNQAHVFAITESEAKDALDKGDSFNMNTGWVSLAATTSLAYFKNDEDNPFVIDSIIVGFKQGATTDQPYVEILRNPSLGTVIDAAVDMPQVSNSLFDSSEVFKTSTLTYKGATGETLTDGTVHATLGAKLDTRSVYPIALELGRGSSIGLKIYPDLSSGTVDCYVAIIGHIRDPKNIK